MIGGMRRAWDNLRGAGDAAVTVPPLDGALRPNRRLDEAALRFPLADVDDLAVVRGTLLASAGHAVHALEGSAWRARHGYDAGVVALAAFEDDGLAVARADGEIVLEGRRFLGRRLRIAPEVNCITAMVADGAALYVANGSAGNPTGAWQRDLLQRNASGSLWRIDLESGTSARIAEGLAWPAGLALDGGSLVCSEAWKHRLVRIDAARPRAPQVLVADLPGYPGRIAPSDGGHWLAVFAPRTQLVEFVLRETAYRRRMIDEVPEAFWIAPKLRAGRSFYEPLQGGGVKHLGILKPWAPTMSAGLCIRLGEGFLPSLSLHSRADGETHGVTAVAELGGRIFAAAQGDGVVVGLDAEDVGDPL